MVHLVPGALHIHSLYSDGTENIEYIAKEAQRAGLKWIIVTDHNTIKGLENNEEGWYDGVAVIIGEEISPDVSDHYLALNINEHISQKQSPQDYVNRVKSVGGFGFIAHPDESTTRKNKYRPLNWSDFGMKDFGGIEIWNFLSNWVDAYDPKNPLYSYLKRNHVLSGPTSRVLKWWDDLNNENPYTVIPAVCGGDVHSLNYRLWRLNIRIFSYYDSFSYLTNFLNLDNELSSDFFEAKEQIYTALREGRNTIINRFWGCKNGEFDFYVENSDRAYSGQFTSDRGSSTIFVKVPEKATIRLIVNGELIREVNANKLVYKDAKAGKYRAEIYYKDHPWVFTNPVVIKKEDQCLS